jgi:pimeloyl-ACP methyl ester carboxylesterase
MGLFSWSSWGQASALSRLSRAERRLFASGLSWHQARSKGSPQELQVLFDDVDDGHGGTIHTVAVAAGAKRAAPPLVCLHGYASGSGIYYAAAAPLAERWPGPVYILDSPGTGLSSRPPWTKVTAQTCPLEEAEGFFIDRLEGWRRNMGIDRMVLCGHSLGGYLSVAYSEKHGQHVERLVLASPVGVPRAPVNLNERIDNAPLPIRVLAGLWKRGWGPFPVVRWGPGVLCAKVDSCHLCRG